MLPHLASRLYGTPLLIARSKLDVILSVLGTRIGLPESQAAIPLPAPRAAGPAAPSGIAVIPVHGTLVRRALGLEAASGLTSYDEIGGRLDAALADPNVHGILLDVDSPGGEAGGVFDLAEKIRAAGAHKPIWAIADEAAFSAAYALACAASRLLLTRTAGVGSIGVIALHVDQSVKDAKDGLHYTAICAGARKNDYSPHAPLSPDAQTGLQAEVDRLYGLFVTQVAALRGLAPDVVRATEAALFFGEQAVAAGFADGIATRTQALAEFDAFLRAQRSLHKTASKPQAPASLTEPPTALTEITMPEETHTPPPPTPVSAVTVPSPSGERPTTPQAATTPDAHAEAQAIAELCLLAGHSERTAEFLSARMSAAQVRRVLLDARAEQPEIASRITLDAGTQSPPQASPVVAAVKKLIHKE